MNRRFVPVALLVFAAAACTGDHVSPRATPSPINTGGPTASAASGATDAPQASGLSAEIELVITDGPHDGSYRAVAVGACHSEPAQNKFTVTYADNAAPDGFVALDLVLNDVATATDDSSGDFTASISVGGANGGVTYSIAPRTGEGDGDALIDLSPFDATLDVEMDARDGATIELTVLCGLS